MPHKRKQQKFERTARPKHWVSTLHKRRAWFAGDPEPEAEEQPTEQEPEESAPKDLDEARKVMSALEKRLSERDATIKSLHERMASIEKAQRKKLEEEGNYKELLQRTQAEAEELRMRAEQATELEAIIRASNEERMKRIPERWRKAVPASDLSPARLQVWLNENEALLTAPPPPDYDAGAGGNGRRHAEPELTQQELEAAKRARMTPEEWMAAKRKMQQQEE